MDAVQNRIPILKIALPILTALLLLAPGHATASTSFVVNPNSVTLSPLNNGGNVQVSSSDGSTITFTATVNYPSDQPSNWISMNGGFLSHSSLPNLTTTTTLTFQAGLVPVDNTATVTLHATNPASGVADATITVTYSAQIGGGGGGGGSVAIYANPAAVVTDNSSTPFGQQQITLTTNSTSSVSFTLGTTTPATWLTVGYSALAVDVNDPATLTLQFNSTGLTAGEHDASITINYGSSQSLTISVAYTVIASTVVTLTPASAIWTTTARSTTVQVSASTSTISVVVSASNPWILLSWPNAPSNVAPVSALYGVQTSIGFIALFNTSVAAPAAGTQGTVTVTDGNQHSSIFTVTYNGTGGGGGSGTVTLTPNPATMSSALNAGCCAQATITVTSTVSGSLTASLSGVTCAGSCLSLSTPSSITAGTPVSVVVYGNSTGLTTGTYYGTLTATVTSGGTASQGTSQVNFVVGGGSTTGGAVVAPTSLVFSIDANHYYGTIPQYVTIADQGSYTATVTSGAPWLALISASGTSGGYSSPALLEVTVGPNGLTNGTYNGTVSIQSPSGTTLVSVTMTIYATPVIYVAAGGPGGPGTLNITESGGNLGVVPQPYIFASDSSAMNVQASISGSPSWLQLNLTSGTTSSTQPLVFPITVMAANLPNGLYTTVLTFTTSTATNSPLSVPVVLSVGGSQVSSGIAVSQSPLTLNGTVNGSTTSAQLGVTATSTTSFTATASVSSGGVNWLSVTPSGTASTTVSYLTVTANPSGLTAGTYYGTVTVTGGGGQASAQIVFVVSTSGGGGGNVVSNPTSLTFTYQVNGTVPSSQSLLISNQTSGTGQIPFTVATSVNGNVSNWLTANVNGQSGVTSGQTQATVVVGVTPGSLPAGPYTGTVIITPSGGNVLSIPVTLTVQGAATVTATPLQLSYSYQLGGTTPGPQAVQVSGSATGLPYSVQVSTLTGSGWLSVNKTSGSTPDVLSVSVSPSSLAAGASYTGTVTIQGTGAAAGSTPARVAVTLTVTAPFPTITLVENAASLASGPAGMVSPGEIVTLFGTGLGPTAPLQTAIDPTTQKVATTLGNVQVLFNGYPAPLTYVSAGQINCVVPYELALLSSPYVEVKYQNQTSNTYNLRAVATAPGIFTIGSGTGQGAILNSDSTYNGTGTGFKPAAAGSTIQIYMTGEGQTSPAGVTGKVNCPSGSACTIPMLPVPLLPVAALVNNQPATIVFYGEAPGLVSGVMQVNLVIPPNTPSGPASLAISVGSVSSQAGVTVAVQ
jgi:uncharacterized protein (TIGR03437 family)